MTSSITEREDFETLVREFLSGDVGTPPPPPPEAVVCRGGRHLDVGRDVPGRCVADGPTT